MNKLPTISTLLRGKVLVVAALTLLIGGTPFPAHAAITVYTNAAAFAAATSATTTVGFDSIAVPSNPGYVAYAPPSPNLTVNGVKFSVVNANVALIVNKTTYYPSYPYPHQYIVNSSNPGQNNQVNITFNPTLALSLTWDAYTGGKSTTFTFSSGDSYTVTSSPGVGSPSFIGFVSTTPVNSLSIVTTQDAWIIENFSLDNSGKAYAGTYGGIKLNWKQTGDGGCGTACAKTAAASVLWLGKGITGTQTQATHWYGVTTDPGDTWTITGLGSNIYTIASAVNGKCLQKDSVGSYLLMANCNPADTKQQWQIMPYSPTGETNGVSFVNPTTGNYAHLVPTAGTQEMYVDGTGNNWKGVFFLTPPPPPDHFRFEFDKNGFLTCQPVDINIKACRYATATEAACTTFYPSSITLTPGATKGTWSGLTGGTTDTFTGSDTVALTDTTAEATTLSYSGATVTPSNATLECYDTSTSAAVSCTQSFAACSNFIDAVEVSASKDPSRSPLYTKLAGVPFDIDIVGPTKYVGRVTVDLIDTTSTAWSCPATPSSILPVTFSAPNGSNNYVNSLTSGRATFTVTSNIAAKKVRIRMLDALGNCYNSSDYFSIRPTEFQLALTNAGNPLVAGTLASAGAGATGVTLTATARVGWGGSPATSTGNVLGGYLGTPTVNWTAAAPTDLNGNALGAAVNTLVTGNFAAGSGTSASGTYYYDDFGTLTLANVANIVVDQTFATDSGDIANNECDSTVSPYSNTKSGGKYGCYVPSAAPGSALITNRFRPAYYTASSQVNAGCSGSFTYIGQKFGGGSLTLTAKSAAGTTLSRLNGSPANAPSYYTAGYDGTTALGSLGLGTLPTATTPPPASNWTAGSYTVAGTTISTTRPTTAPVGPYSAFKLALTVNDADSVRITSCTDSSGNLGTITNSTTYSTCLPPTGTLLRYGVLKMGNAYGSELLPLYVPLTMLYWNGTNWQQNTDDSCTATSLTTSRVAVSQVPTGTDMIAPTATSIIPGSAGSATIKFAATGAGHTGSADIALNLSDGDTSNSCASSLSKTSAAPDLSWLRGNWCNNSYAKAPSARVNFGTAKSPFLYRREKY